jgi:hypothetical protein
MAVKATLQIVLKADNVVIAESDDAGLWGQTLARITGSPLPTTAVPIQEKLDAPKRARPSSPTLFEAEDAMTWPADALQAFATELRLDPVVIEGACDPTTTAPYLRLDVHTWEDFKRNTGKRGTNAVPQIGLAATLLLLWFRRSQSGAAMVTVSQAQAVLKTIGLRDKNVGRGLKNCDWLQAREDDTIRLNPSKFSTALEWARVFCARKSLDALEGVEKD